ncbi:hypothetical protein ScalyP_jg10945, partial [Parmales sp. scaly parma]
MLKYLLLLAFLVSKSTSLQLSHHHSPAAKSTFQLHSTSPRRAFLSAAVAATATTLTLPSISQALPEEDELIDVYFGCGCFWHVMHEFVVGEITILKRTEAQLTSRAAYAGGTRVGANDRVCYHNMASKDDYGRYGHAEVVSLTIPKSSFEAFCEIYFNLFN